MSYPKLTAVDGATLMDTRLPPLKFCVSSLMPPGICILGGASKIGKSWMVLDLCVRIAKGEPIWGLATQQGTTLYLCLEDTLRRVQDRLNCITDDVPANAYFATSAGTIADGLCDQIRDFIATHPDTILVAINTLQIVRSNVTASYANDYDELRQLKTLADEHNITLLLVHHIRKLGDADPLNRLSGTTAISGSADAIFVLDRSKRSQDNATLFATGRDIECREIDLKFNTSNHVWDLVADSPDNLLMLLPPEMSALVSYVQAIGTYSGSNSQLASLFSVAYEQEITPKALKQKMNKWRHVLEDHGVYYESRRSNGIWLIRIWWQPSSTASDASASKVLGQLS